jgi:hypothetical protein
MIWQVFPVWSAPALIMLFAGEPIDLSNIYWCFNDLLLKAV